MDVQLGAKQRFDCGDHLQQAASHPTSDIKDAAVGAIFCCRYQCIHEIFDINEVTDRRAIAPENAGGEVRRAGSRVGIGEGRDGAGEGRAFDRLDRNQNGLQRRVGKVPGRRQYS